MKIQMLSSLTYPNGKLNSYLFPTEKEALIEDEYLNGTFIWDDIEDVLDASYELPEPYYKYMTGRTSRPYISFYSPKELDDLINFVDALPNNRESNELTHEMKVYICYGAIKEFLKSRNFNAARELLPILGKLNKQDYTCWSDDVLLKLFNIQSNE